MNRERARKQKLGLVSPMTNLQCAAFAWAPVWSNVNFFSTTSVVRTRKVLNLVVTRTRIAPQILGSTSSGNEFFKFNGAVLSVVVDILVDSETLVVT